MILRPYRNNAAKKQVAYGDSIPAPVGGLNGVDAIADMPATDAIILENIFPYENYVAVRKGHVSQSTGLGTAVDSLLVWNGPSSSKLFGCADGKIYNCTASGAVGAADVSGLSNNRWQYVNFTNSGGSYIVAVNGADSPRNYDGSAWATIPAITGPTAADLSYVAVHLARLWFVEKNTMSAWYLAADAIGGAATEFPLGAQFPHGGKLLCIGTLSMDTGDGVNDFIAFLSDEGEIAVYGGSDPDSADTFSLVGKYKTGVPLGSRPLAKLGGDLVILTRDGAVSLTNLMKVEQTKSIYSSVTGKINPLINTDAASYKSHFGWEIVVYSSGKWLIVNVPQSENGIVYQYVMNITTGAWCKFTGMNANCWAVMDDEVYFGGNGKVFKANTGYQDNEAQIAAYLKSAFNYFRSRGSQKQFLMIRPVLASTGTPSYLIGINVDFDDEEPEGNLSVPSLPDESLWDTAVWDEDEWGGATRIVKAWTGIAGIGMCAAVRMSILVNGENSLINAFDVLYARGGPL